MGSAAPSLFPRLSELGGGGEAAPAAAMAAAARRKAKGRSAPRTAAILTVLWVCLETQSERVSVFTPGAASSPRGALRALELSLHPLLMEGFAGGG